MIITTTDSSVKIEDNSGIVWTGGLNTFVLTYSAPEDSVTLFDDTRLIATGKLTDSTINGTQLTGDNIDSALQDIFSTAGSNSGTGGVSSVNGYTGNVALTAADVNAYTQDQVDTMLGQLNTAEFAGPYATIDVIPTPYDTNDLYLVGDAVPYAIYANVAGVLTQIGSSSVDLSDYYTKDEIDSIGEADPIFNAWKNGTSVVIGSSSTGTGIAIGNIAQGAGIAIGKNSVSSANNSISLGNNARSLGTGIAIGYLAAANINYGVAIGASSSTIATNGVAIAYNAYNAGNNGVAIGYNASTLGQNSVALGTQSQAKNPNEIGIGANNKIVSGSTAEQNTQFTVASYSADTSTKRNALEIRQNDDIWIFMNNNQVMIQDYFNQIEDLKVQIEDLRAQIGG
ncbi:MAG: hypothetical protein LBV71_16095 [Prevotella sp.]|jgi:hypothetical protein|nr:hypothetical protein [Prevotella sp.]